MMYGILTLPTKVAGSHIVYVNTLLVRRAVERAFCTKRKWCKRRKGGAEEERRLVEMFSMTTRG